MAVSMDKDTLNLDDVVAVLAERHGIPAYVEQTGGGCATIYAGTPERDDAGDLRYPILAGPGWFTGPGWTHGRASLGEFFIGPDDDGDSRPVEPRDTGAVGSVAVAALIAAQVRA